MGLNMIYAIVNTANNIVENVIVLDDGVEWSPPQGFISVPLVDIFGIGDTWDGTNFIRFVPPVPVTPQPISEGTQTI